MAATKEIFFWKHSFRLHKDQFNRLREEAEEKWLSPNVIRIWRGNRNRNHSGYLTQDESTEPQ
jgi:hypothetical protein